MKYNNTQAPEGWNVTVTLFSFLLMLKIQGAAIPDEENPGQYFLPGRDIMDFNHRMVRMPRRKKNEN